MAILSENILSMLNEQYRHETNNYFLYTQRRSWADFKGFNNVADFFKQEAEGEKGHAEKVMAFILDRNSPTTIDPLSFDAPSIDNDADLIDLFKTALEVEFGTTEALTAIYQAAMGEGDIMTVTLMHDMIAYQVEEERHYQNIIDRFSIYPASPSRDHDLDIYIGETFVK